MSFQRTNPPAGANWNNNQATVPGDTTLSNLKDFASGSNTGWSLFCDEIGTVGSSDSSGVNSAGSGDATWVNEAVISVEGHFFSVGANGYDLTFSGLNSANTYTIEFFGSGTSAGRVLSVTLDPFGEQTLALNNNSTQVIRLTDVQPDGSGQIGVIHVIADDTSSGAAIVNALRIVETVTASTVYVPLLPQRNRRYSGRYM